MKKFIRFYRAPDGLFELEDTEHVDLLIIAFFLLHDASENEDLYKSWAGSPEEVFEGGEFTTLHQDSQHNVTINCVMDEDEDYEPLHITLSKENFLDLLIAWETVSSCDPAEITIEQEANGSYTVK